MTISLPGACTDPSRRVPFTFEGRSISAVHGQSIAAALVAAGVRVFSRSIKYHRPRGLFCVSGDCPNCLMQVDGRPNVRTCIEPVQAGQVVKAQNAWPSLDFDVLRIFDKLDRFLPIGFHYKHFHKPRWLWPIFEHVMRRLAGLGRIDVAARPSLDAAVEHLHVEVCVIGGGPAGLAAAKAAAEAGAEVLLLERLPLLGGQLLYRGMHARNEPVALLQTGKGKTRTLLGTSVFGLYEGNLVGAFQGDRLLKIRASQVIVCTGTRQTLVPFHGNDLPGILSLDGVLRLGRLYGVRAGQSAVVLTDRRDSAAAAQELRALGIEVAATIPFPTRQSAPDVILQALGNRHLRAVRLVQVNEQGMATLQEFACDLLCLDTELVPANELLLQAGMRFRFETGRWQPAQNVPGVLAAGGAAGLLDLAAQIADGQRRGWEAAALLGHETPATVASGSEVVPETSGTLEAIRLGKDLGADARFGKRFVCLCEDVTVKDVDQAIAEGFDGIETLKRYTAVNMGPCQGKMCGPVAAALCARATGKDLNQIGATTSRPPAVPVELAVLAAERRLHPVRRTPMHHWHETAGARWMNAGQWMRPESYGDPLAEMRAVRESVGLIDVSTLGKIEVIGPDAATLLERVYLNSWQDLRIGKTRYGAMCTEDGILFDDGIGARLAQDHFCLATTTGNAEAVLQWLELWRATWRLNAIVLTRTSALAAMNLAGPHARKLLSTLTTLDLSASSFPYMTMRAGEVAGVSCRLFRIGFVGERGYEIHCASQHGLHVWESLMEAGAELGIKPFGVEAQRVLRLEKGHLIVGQDTDALSDPFGAGLQKMVRFDKPQFHGRAALLRRQERGVASRLVGFHLPEVKTLHADERWAHRLEGRQVVEQGRPAGRVTSARYSPTLKQYVGLAWIPSARCAAGERFVIHGETGDLSAQVATMPFYDPDGKRLTDRGADRDA